ncbi:MAG TPA: glutamate dehydrogenase, partial [bacterium]|nr:glutamate dehydrogenase [bacterium]
QLGGKVVTLSGSDGYIYDEDGVKGEKVDFMQEMRAKAQDMVEEYADEYGVPFYAGERPWGVKVDVALPCATENEIRAQDARQLIDNGCVCVVEGANMPFTPEAVDLFLGNGILFGPGKAANAGGVSVSGLEMSQDSMRLQWSRDEVDSRLHYIMKNIHKQCVKYGREGDAVNYVKGANLAGFIKVADAMLDQGVV